MNIKRASAAVAVGIALLGSTFAFAGTASAKAPKAAKPNAKAKILTLSDMPSGWSINNSSSNSDSEPACLSGLKGTPKGGTRASVSFEQNGNIPSFNEVLTTGPDQRARLVAANKALAGCKNFSFTASDGTNYTASIGALSFPKVGDKSSAYSVSFSVKGINVGIDLVLFRSGAYSGAVEYADVGSPDVGALQSLVNLAVAKTKSASSSTGTASAAAHVGSAQTIAGTSGTQGSVTVTQVIDPATGSDQYTTPDAGKRFVAVALSIKNTGSSAFQGDADSDSTLIGSDNQSYTSSFDSVSGCTDFNDGEYQLNVGETAAGCVTFQLPTGVNPAKFQYSADGGSGGAFAEWQIP